jgi:hypothetical protein
MKAVRVWEAKKEILVGIMIGEERMSKKERCYRADLGMVEDTNLR